MSSNNIIEMNTTKLPQSLESGKEYTAIVENLAYNLLQLNIPELQKRFYAQRFAAPEGKSRAPDMSKDISPIQLNKVRADVFRKMIDKNNFAPDNFSLTSLKWFPGLFIGDSITFTVTAKGVIGYKPVKKDLDLDACIEARFTEAHPVIKGTENDALSCVGVWNGMPYNFYLTDEPTPQYAKDVAWILVNPTTGKIYCKVLIRGTGATVDFGGMVVMVAGEHVEPGIDVDKLKAILRTIHEELGLPTETLMKCYFVMNPKVYDSADRDSRYALYHVEQDGEIITCGVQRYSSTTLTCVIMVSESIPDEIPQADTVEINTKFWTDFDTISDMFDKFAFPDHIKFVEVIRDTVTMLIAMSEGEREQFLLENLQKSSK